MEGGPEQKQEPLLKKTRFPWVKNQNKLNQEQTETMLKLKDITRKEYLVWINELAEKYSVGTIRRIHSLKNFALNNAVLDYQLLKTNPIQKIKMPLDNSEKKLKFFTTDELSKFLDVLKKPVKNAKYKQLKQYLVLFTLMARTGLRIGEALALTWNDIDFGNQTINVDKTIVYPLNSTPYRQNL